MTIQRGNYLIGVFDDQSHAVRAVEGLHQSGFGHEQVSLLARERVAAAPDRATVDLQETAGTSAIVGAVAGGALGLAAGAVAAAVLPGIGPFVMGGLLATAGGGALGAAFGAYAGPFVALGLNEDIAQHYARHVESGRTVVVVRAGERQDQARQILETHGAYDDSMNPP